MAVHQKTTITLPRTLTPEQRARVGELLIDTIQSRTDKGMDRNGNKFTKYSDSYKKSLDFRLAGKSSTVDLKLSGDMMRSMEVLGQGTGFVTIGFQSGSDTNDKASYAKDFANGPTRDFLGVSASEIATAVNAVQSDTLDSNVRSLISNFSFGLFS